MREHERYARRVFAWLTRGPYDGLCFTRNDRLITLYELHDIWKCQGSLSFADYDRLIVQRSNVVHWIGAAEMTILLRHTNKRISRKDAGRLLYFALATYHKELNEMYDHMSTLSHCDLTSLLDRTNIVRRSENCHGMITHPDFAHAGLEHLWKGVTLRAFLLCLLPWMIALCADCCKHVRANVHRRPTDRMTRASVEARVRHYYHKECSLDFILVTIHKIKCEFDALRPCHLPLLRYAFAKCMRVGAYTLAVPFAFFAKSRSIAQLACDATRFHRRPGTRPAHGDEPTFYCCWKPYHESVRFLLAARRFDAANKSRNYHVAANTDAEDADAEEIDAEEIDTEEADDSPDDKRHDSDDCHFFDENDDVTVDDVEWPRTAPTHLDASVNFYYMRMNVHRLTRVPYRILPPRLPYYADNVGLERNDTVDRVVNVIFNFENTLFTRACKIRFLHAGASVATWYAVPRLRYLLRCVFVALSDLFVCQLAILMDEACLPENVRDQRLERDL